MVGFPDCFSLSIAIYVGNGQFCYENDVFNMAELAELIKESGWAPPKSAHVPPAKLDRNQLPPARARISARGAWRILDTGLPLP